MIMRGIVFALLAIALMQATPETRPVSIMINWAIIAMFVAPLACAIVGV